MNLLKISEAAKLLGVSKDTLRRWEASGKINSIRTPSGYRVYDLQEIERVKNPPSPSTPTLTLPLSYGEGTWGNLLPSNGEGKNGTTSYSGREQFDSFPLSEEEGTESASFPLFKGEGQDGGANSGLWKSIFIASSLPLILGALTLAFFLLAPQKAQSLVASLPKPVSKLLSFTQTSHPHPNLLPSREKELTKAPSPLAGEGRGEGGNPRESLNVLAESTEGYILEINSNTNINGLLTATKISGEALLNSILPGENISLTQGSNGNLTLSAVLPANLVNTVQGQSGAVTFIAGTDIAISGLTVSNTSTLSTVRGRGGCSTCIVSDDINTLVATKLTGTIESARLSGSYTGITTVGTLSELATGATTISSTLAVTGATTLSSYIQLSQISAPSTTTNRLYNVSGNLVWNGTNLSAGGALPVGTTGQTMYNSSGTWTASSNLYHNGTNVGIGTTAPAVPLHISAGVDVPLRIESTNSYAPGFDIWASGSRKGTFGIVTSGNQFVTGSQVNDFIFRTDGGGNIIFADSTASTQLFKIMGSGNVGIGTTLPSSKLGVLGNLSLGATYGNVAAPTSGLIVEGNVGIGTTNPGATLETAGAVKIAYGTTQGSTSPTPLTIERTASAWAPLASFKYRADTSASFTNTLTMTQDNSTTNGMMITGIGNLSLESGSAIQIRESAAHAVFFHAKTTTQRLGIGTINPPSKLSIVGNTSIGATYGDVAAPTSGLIVEGNVGIGTTAPAGKLEIVGGSTGAKSLLIRGNSSNDANIQEWQNNAGTALSYINSSGNFVKGDFNSGQFNNQQLTRTVDGTANRTVEIGNFTGTGTSARNIFVQVLVNSGGFSTANSYFISTNYNTGGWVTVNPHSSTGAYSSNAIALDVNVDNGANKLYLRLRRTGGSTAATATINIQNWGDQTETFAATSTTSTDSSTLSQLKMFQNFNAQGTGSFGTLDTLGGATTLSSLSSASLISIGQTSNGGDTPSATEAVFSLIRNGVSGQSYPNVVDFKLGKYTDSGNDPKTQLDIALSDTGSGAASSTIMSLRANGNVGIGTTAPGSKLTVSAGDISIWNSGAFKIYDSTGATQRMGISHDDTDLTIANNRSSSAADILFNTQGSLKLTIGGDGGLTIATPSQPTASGTSAGTAGIAGLTSTAGTGGDTTITTTGTGGVGGGFSLTGGIGGLAASATTASTGGAGGALTFTTGTGGAATVTAGVKVGGAGGTFNLVGGDGGATSGAGTSNTGGAGGSLYLVGGIGGTASGATTNTAGASGNVLLGITSAGVARGNVGIGTTAPSAALEVKASGTGVIAKFTSTNTTGCTLADGGTISCTSDRNFKKNIGELNYGLDTLMALNPVEYNWKTETEGTARSLGFIAQEVEAIVPNLVTTDSSSGFKQLNTIGLVPVLAKAIQEQQEQINELKAVYKTDEQGYLIMPKIKAEKIIVNDELRIMNDGVTLSAGPFDSSKGEGDNTVPSPLWGEGQGEGVNYIDVASRVQSSEFRIQNLEEKDSTSSAKLAVLGENVASQSARIDELKRQLEALLGLNKESSPSSQPSPLKGEGDLASSIPSPLAGEGQVFDSEGLSPQAQTRRGEGDIALLNLTPPDILLATGSATLAKIDITEKASILNLEAFDATISASFKSLGDTFLGRTTVAGDLSVDGTLSITSGNTIDAFPILYLQSSPLASLVDIFNGLVTIDNTGKLAVHKLAVSSDTLGTVTIKAGQRSVEVITTQLTRKSKVFTTSSKPAVLGVQKDTNHTKFIISLDKPSLEDITIDWWIVDSR